MIYLRKRCGFLALALCFLFSLSLLTADLAYAKGGGGGGFSGGGGRSGGFSGGGSFKSSSSFSHSPRPTTTSTSVFNRSSGGIHKSSGYQKPGTPITPSTAGKYDKPGTPSTGKSAPISASKPGYTKPGTAPGTDAKPSLKAIAPGKPLGSQFDKKYSADMQKQRSGESLKQYKAEQAKFKQPAAAAGDYKGSPIYQNTQTYGRFDYGNYYSRRDGYYRSYGWSPPVYVYNSYPSFGMWDVMFWWMILDRHNDRNYVAMAYNQANDPGYRKWREEAERMAKDNKDLREKLDKLDSQVKQMEGKPRDSAYLPPGMPPEVALSAEVLKAKDPLKPKLRFAGGFPYGHYDRFGQLLKKEASNLNVEVGVIHTAGSLENVKLLANGKADAALVESDVLAWLPKKYPGKKLIAEQSAIYTEVIQMLANTASGIYSVKDIDPKKHVLYVGPEGSGTSVCWKGLCLQDKSYSKIPVKHADYMTALADTVKNPNAIMMFTSGLKTPLIREAEEIAKKTGKLRLVSVDDWDFDNKKDEHGNKIYSFVTIPHKVYPNLTGTSWWFWGRDVKTLSVQAVLVLRTDWLKTYGEDAMDALSFAVMQVAPVIHQEVDGLK